MMNLLVNIIGRHDHRTLHQESLPLYTVGLKVIGSNSNAFFLKYYKVCAFMWYMDKEQF